MVEVGRGLVTWVVPLREHQDPRVVAPVMLAQLALGAEREMMLHGV